MSATNIANCASDPTGIAGPALARSNSVHNINAALPHTIFVRGVHDNQLGRILAIGAQAVLKRKHWDEGANSRHQALFAQQMQQASMRLTPSQAEAHEALRTDVRHPSFSNPSSLFSARAVLPFD